MSYDSTANSTSDPDRPSRQAGSDEKQEKKPFVEPALRRETKGFFSCLSSDPAWRDGRSGSLVELAVES
jgi:hypothetical protein